MNDLGIAVCLATTAAVSILAACSLGCCVRLLDDGGAGHQARVSIDSESDDSGDEEVYSRVAEPPEPLRVRLVRDETQI